MRRLHAKGSYRKIYKEKCLFFVGDHVNIENYQHAMLREIKVVVVLRYIFYGFFAPLL